MSAEVLVKFKGDTKNLDKKTTQASSSLKGFASGVGSAFKVAGVAITAATTAVSALVTSSVKAFAEFEQLEGGLKSLFKDSMADYDIVMAKSKTAWQDLTMSQNEYLNAFEGSYSLIKNGLADESKAIEYTNKALQLSSDLFNTYGKSTEYYQNAIDWALKGTFSYIDNLNIGIKGTSEGFVEAANKSGILARNVKDVKELTNEEILDVIQHYADKAGAWGKTQQEASTTVIGSLNMVKATWQNLVSGFSQKDADISGLMDNLIKSAMTFIDQILPVLERALYSIADALPGLIDRLVQMLPGMLQKLLPVLIDSAVLLLEGLANSLPTIIPVLMDGIIQAIKGLVKVLPTLIRSILEGALLIIQALAEELPTMLPEIVDAIVQVIPMLIDYLPLFLEAGGQLLVGLLKGIVMSVPKIIAQIPALVRSIINAFKSYFGIHSPSTVFADIGTNLIKGLWNGIQNVTSWIVGKIKGFGNSVLKAIKGIFGVHSPSTEFEWIGKMNMVGFEQGMEDMKGKVQDTIDSVFSLQPNVSGQMSSTYSPQVQVNVQNNMEMDPLGQLVNRVKTFSGGAKNDYNWGAGL